MKETYTVKYRQLGQWFWRKIKNVKATGFSEQSGFWVFETGNLTGQTGVVIYRQPGQWFWRKIKNVKAMASVAGTTFLAIHTEHDSLHYISKKAHAIRILDDKEDHYVPGDAEVYFPPERQAIITHQMSREIGQPIARV